MPLVLPCSLSPARLQVDAATVPLPLPAALQRMALQAGPATLVVASSPALGHSHPSPPALQKQLESKISPPQVQVPVPSSAPWTWSHLSSLLEGSGRI